MPLLHFLHLPILCSSRNPNSNPKSPPLSSPHPPLLLRFRPSRRQKIQYLKTLGVDTSSSSSSSMETLDWILSIVDYLKSKGFSDSHFPRLSFLCPRIFSSADIDRTLAPVFAFLATDLSADPEQARDLILRCPELLVSNVEHRLRPTLQFLRELGLKNLNSPTNLNAHLLNTPIEKLVSKIRFLQSLGFSYEEAARLCARCPAIFGYSVENNLRPKIEYLVNDMGRSVVELKKFPQYLAFSLKKRIVPRHLHLKQRGVQIPLQRMLLWSDERFYAKWK
ncbi:transcription termination factor MTEF1, chloroplastic [Cocos nucifera]|uniref:Transcription termination factor MTEF1, chloroplastic n=1 Tax=Cocos nucifera TaxID=13894 RepID=A0A8K0I8E5_COCNU|nr:transcription termination factor MTEF1, chloroplastic [Cocos nucifera]